MTSSPGSSTPNIEAIIASVEPQVTQICVSGSASIPYQRRYFSAIAARNSSEPQVIGYWLMSSATARRAASFNSAGAAKSGKPCDRLIAPWAFDSLVISRMTDSENERARAEGRTLDIEARIAGDASRPRASCRGCAAARRDPSCRRGRRG